MWCTSTKAARASRDRSDRVREKRRRRRRILIGLVAAICLAFLLDHQKASIHRREEVEDGAALRRGHAPLHGHDGEDLVARDELVGARRRLRRVDGRDRLQRGRRRHSDRARGR